MCLLSHCSLGLNHDGADKQGVPKGIHDSLAGTPSIPADTLNAMTSAKAMNSFSGLSKHIIPAAWSLAQRIALEKNVQLAGLAWHSALAVIGDVLVSEKDCLAIFVNHSVVVAVVAAVVQ